VDFNSFPITITTKKITLFQCIYFKFENQCDIPTIITRSTTLVEYVPVNFSIGNIGKSKYGEQLSTRSITYLTKTLVCDQCLWTLKLFLLSTKRSR
jgi:hypothetical protein